MSPRPFSPIQPVVFFPYVKVYIKILKVEVHSRQMVPVRLMFLLGQQLMIDFIIDYS